MRAPIRPAPRARLADVCPPHVRAVIDAPPRARPRRRTSSAGPCATCSSAGPPKDWDLATDARPERMLHLFPGAVYENAFGTVAVRRDGDVLEVTTFRNEHEYADFRRPHRLEFGDDIRRRPRPPRLHGERDRLGRRRGAGCAGGGRRDRRVEPSIVDPFDGIADLDARVLRAVGDPGTRFREDALRMVRAVRLAATLELERRARDAGRDRAPTPPLVAHLSGERIGAELAPLLAAPRPVGRAAPGRGDRAARRHRRRSSPRSAACRRTRSTARTSGTTRCGRSTPRPAERPIVRLAALLHDIGKPATLADGHFHHHDVVGADAGGRAAATAPGSRAPRSRPSRSSSATTCSRSIPTPRAPRSGASSSGSASTTSTPCSSSAAPTTSGPARPGDSPSLARVPGADRRGARRRGGARPLRAQDRRHGPHARAGARAGAAAGPDPRRARRAGHRRPRAERGRLHSCCSHRACLRTCRTRPRQ